MKLGGSLFVVSLLVLLGCEGEWVGGTLGKTACDLRNFNGFYTAVKMSADRDNLYILDNSSKVHFYKRDNLYECSFDFEYTYHFNGFLDDVFSLGNTFYVQDKASLKSREDVTLCDARDGSFAIYGNELAVGSNMGIETWSINSCTKTGNVSSWKVLSLAATSSDYFAAEGISAEPRNLAMYSKSGASYSDPMSITPGNEKNFCSADRLVANNHGVYLLDKTCKKIGVYDNRAVWRKSISLDSLGIRGVLDIAPAEYSYIFILHSGGVEKVNVF